MRAKTIITALLALVAFSTSAQTQNPRGLYRLSEIVHKD